jgi:hypothetical protein
MCALCLIVCTTTSGATMQAAAAGDEHNGDAQQESEQPGLPHPPLAEEHDDALEEGHGPNNAGNAQVCAITASVTRHEASILQYNSAVYALPVKALCTSTTSSVASVCRHASMQSLYGTTSLNLLCLCMSTLYNTLASDSNDVSSDVSSIVTVYPDVIIVQQPSLTYARTCSF